MKVALAQSFHADGTFPSYEVAQMAGCARQYGHEPFLAGLAAPAAADLAVVYTTLAGFASALDAARRLKRHGARTVVLAGGVFLHEESLRPALREGAVDAVAAGIGDHTLPLILRDLRVFGKPVPEPELYVRSSDARGFELPVAAAPAGTLDDLPFADFSVFGGDARSLRLRSHRGCPCGGVASMGGRRLFLELSFQRRCRPDLEFVWLDDSFGALPTAELRVLCALLREARSGGETRPLPWGLHTAWGAGWDRDLVGAMAGAGAVRLAFNVFAGDGRPGWTETLAAARARGMSVSVNRLGAGDEAADASVGRVCRNATHPALGRETVCWWQARKDDGGQDYTSLRGSRIPGFAAADPEAALVPLEPTLAMLMLHRRVDRPGLLLKYYIEGESATAELFQETSLLADYARDLRRLLTAARCLAEVRRLCEGLGDAGLAAETCRRLGGWFEQGDRRSCAAHRRTSVVQSKGPGLVEKRTHEFQRVERLLVCARWRLSQVSTHEVSLSWDGADGPVIAWGKERPVEKESLARLIYGIESRRAAGAGRAWFHSLAGSPSFRRTAMECGLNEFRRLAEAETARARGDWPAEVESLLGFLAESPGEPHALALLARAARRLSWVRSAWALLERANRVVAPMRRGEVGRFWALVDRTLQKADRKACDRLRRARRRQRTDDPMYPMQPLMRWLVCARWRLSLAGGTVSLWRDGDAHRFTLRGAERDWTLALVDPLLERCAAAGVAVPRRAAPAAELAAAGGTKR
jgi:hypothetical protein